MKKFEYPDTIEGEADFNLDIAMIDELSMHILFEICDAKMIEFAQSFVKDWRRLNHTNPKYEAAFYKIIDIPEPTYDVLVPNKDTCTVSIIRDGKLIATIG